MADTAKRCCWVKIVEGTELAVRTRGVFRKENGTGLKPSMTRERMYKDRFLIYLKNLKLFPNYKPYAYYPQADYIVQ